MKVDKAYIRISEGVTGKVLIAITDDAAREETKIAIPPLQARLLAENIMTACTRVERRMNRPAIQPEIKKLLKE